MTAADILAAPPAERISLTELAHQERCAPSTTWRWATKGVRGIRLPSVMRGSKRQTTRAAFEAWCERLTAAADGPPAPEVTTAEFKEDDEARAKRAEEELARMGIDPG
jgi:hypothetical protein